MINYVRYSLVLIFVNRQICLMSLLWWHHIINKRIYAWVNKEVRGSHQRRSQQVGDSKEEGRHIFSSPEQAQS